VNDFAFRKRLKADLAKAGPGSQPRVSSGLRSMAAE
jgi:hypothetical protein